MVFDGGSGDSREGGGMGKLKGEASQLLKVLFERFAGSIDHLQH
jgi:hypothetical protein